MSGVVQEVYLYASFFFVVGEAYLCASALVQETYLYVSYYIMMIKHSLFVSIYKYNSVNI